MAAIKDRLKTDLVAAMKAHDENRKSTVRMALAAIANEEVAGKAARDLSEAEEQAVLAREVAKRKDAAEAYTAGNRPELAEKELSEAALLAGYLPRQLTEAEIAAIVDEEVAAATATLGDKPTMRQMGLVMKAVTPRIAGRGDGKTAAALVRAALG
ncbi:MAG: GatB/YqeY domain-containing protein [Micropruina sp.]|nr:GatB/YqeY domain-containing protein [Micropruina sp.]